MENVQHQQEAFRGHFDECFQNFVENFALKFPPKSKGATKAKEPLAQFCGVEVGTSRRWFMGKMPNGEVRFRLMCYLDLMGYKVIELENMPKSQRGFLELISFNLINAEEAALSLGYTQFSSLSQVFQGNCNTSPEKDNKMWEIWKNRKHELEAKKEDARKLYCLNLSTKIAPPKNNVVQEQAAPGKLAHFNIMEGLIAMLQEHQLSEDELAENAHVVLRLSAHLTNLCSRLIKDQQKGGSDG